MVFQWVGNPQIPTRKPSAALDFAGSPGTEGLLLVHGDLGTRYAAFFVGAVVEADVFHVKLVTHLAFPVPGRSFLAIFATKPRPFLTIFELPFFNRFRIPDKLAFPAIGSVVASLVLLATRLGISVGIDGIAAELLESSGEDREHGEGINSFSQASKVEGASRDLAGGGD